MISTFASGFIGRKPELLLVGANRRRKVEFDVIWERREKDRRSGEWGSVYERATFEAWDDEAEHIAERFDKGTEVTCTGTQRTSKWTDKEGAERTFKKNELTSFSITRRRPAAAGDGAQQPARAQGAPAPRAPASVRQSAAAPPDDRDQRDAELPGGFDRPGDDPFPGASDEHHEGSSQRNDAGNRKFIDM